MNAPKRAPKRAAKKATKNVRVRAAKRAPKKTSKKSPKRGPVSAKAASQHRWETMPREVLSPLLGRRLITGERMMLAHVYLKKGCLVPLHSHMNEQMTYILEGALRLWLGTEGTAEHRAYDVRAGEVLVIPPNVPHRAEALEDTLDVDIFCPPRQDWLDGSDLYLRNPAR